MRELRADQNAAFAISQTPRGKELVLPELPGNIARAVALLPLDDAMPADKIDFTGAFRTEHKMFDGMVLSSWTVLKDKARWTRFEARLDPARADAALKAGLYEANPKLLKPDAIEKQITEITARTKGWAFMLPGMKSADLTRDYYDLFKNPEPAKQPEDAPAADDDMGMPR